MSGTQQLLLGEGAGSREVLGIEDVFSTYLYTAAGSTQNVNNGVDLSGKGGLLWIKARTSVSIAGVHMLMDSVSGFNKYLNSNATTQQQSFSAADTITATSTGFNVPNNVDLPYTNYLANTYASWTFRKQPKFFDVVTYTGTGVDGRTVAHNLGTTPGCIIVKATSTTSHWSVYHRSIGNTGAVRLNLTGATDTSIYYWNDTSPTSTQFSVANETNSNGVTYVAYLFAHDAGGFGLTGTDNVISCGSFTASGGLATVNLGYEPQLLMVKQSNGAGNWAIYDNMRGMAINADKYYLAPNSTGSETSFGNTNPFEINATGFNVINSYAFPGTGSGSETFIYIAIRRGPMKVPTDATKVFSPVARTGTGAAATVTGASFPPDLGISLGRSAIREKAWHDRLRGATYQLISSFTSAEYNDTGSVTSFNMNGWSLGSDGAGNSAVNSSGVTYVNYFVRRAPTFFDEVCYTGTGTNVQAQAHNLGVAPELMIIKKRSAVDSWFVGKDFTSSNYLRVLLNTTAAGVTTVYDDGVTARDLGAQPTATNFYLGRDTRTNGSGATYVAYLFATCAGVSKVGNYTGTGTTKQVDCGFAAGARFVLIKRTDSTGDWYVWDSARGIVSGNDSYLLLNSTAAEVTNTDYVDTYAAGFEISSTAPAAINANGGTFIFLAIA